MDKNRYSINELFDQLGLDSGDESIQVFVKTHQLPRNVALEKADFWKSWQVQFFRDARHEDAAWLAPVDDLDLRLHATSMQRHVK